MKTMLPSSKLLPATIVAIVAVAVFKTATLVTSVPTLGELRAETSQVMAMAASAAGITQAHAAAADHLSPQPSSLQSPKLQLPQRQSPQLQSPQLQTLSPKAQPASAASRPPAGGEPANLADAVHTPPTTPITPPITSTAAPKPATEAKSGANAPAETPPAASADAIAAAPETLKLPRGQAEDRERQLTQREAMVDAADARLQARVGELVALQMRLQALDAARKERDEANWAGLVKMYEGMRPRDAAAIFNSLDKTVLLEILDRMKPAKAGPLIAAMDAEKARQVTADLANKRLQTTTVSN